MPSANRWRNTHVPIGAMIGTLLDAVWNPDAPLGWVSRDGTIREYVPHSDLSSLMEALVPDLARNEWERASTGYCGSGLQAGGDFYTLRQLYSKLQRQGHHNKAGALRTVAVAATWLANVPTGRSGVQGFRPLTSRLWLRGHSPAQILAVPQSRTYPRRHPPERPLGGSGPLGSGGPRPGRLLASRHHPCQLDCPPAFPAKSCHPGGRRCAGCAAPSAASAPSSLAPRPCAAGPSFSGSADLGEGDLSCLGLPPGTLSSMVEVSSQMGQAIVPTRVSGRLAGR